MERRELEKLTGTKLMELCLEKYPEIQGVSGMKKEEIIEAFIAEEVRLGLRPKTDALRPTGQTVSDLKAQIRLFKTRRNQTRVRRPIRVEEQLQRYEPSRSLRTRRLSRFIEARASLSPS